MSDRDSDTLKTEPNIDDSPKQELLENTENKDPEPNQKVVHIVETIFKNAQLYILAILLVVYLAISLILGSTSSVIFDIVILIIFACYFGYKYMSLDGSGREKAINDFFVNILDTYDNHLALFSVMLFLVCLYVLSFILGLSSYQNKPWTFIKLEVISWILLTTLLIHMSLKHFFKVDVMDYLRESPKSDEASMDTSGNITQPASTNESGQSTQPIDTELKTPEVFNISNNLYTYQDAQAVCQSMDARLATYDEVESAYNNGAEWCTYGWSADQLALFPTQKDTWKKMEGNLREKNKCGRPGVNGGYFMNPNIKFGVNCYGIKPKAKDADLKWMETKKNQPYPKTKEQKLIDEKVEYWKNNASNIVVNSFNKDKWSRY